MIIRVVTEVKAREDEYQLVKHISARIRGLPTETRFARRERRLLYRGSLHHVNIPSDSPLPERTWRDSAQPNGRAALLDGTQRRSRLIEAIAAWDDRRARFGSHDSSGSFAFTTKSRDSSSFSSDHVIPPLVGRSQFYRGTSASNVPVRELSESGGPQHVLVFTDFILLTVPIPRRDQAKDEIEGWQLAENVGISRVLNVGECMHGKYPALFAKHGDCSRIIRGQLPDCSGFVASRHQHSGYRSHLRRRVCDDYIPVSTFARARPCVLRRRGS
jgi:hypothetical protein